MYREYAFVKHAYSKYILCPNTGTTEYRVRHAAAAALKEEKARSGYENQTYKFATASPALLW